MNSTTLHICNLRVDAGTDRQWADPLAKEVLGRDEATKTISTTQDVFDLKVHLRTTSIWVAGLIVGQIAISAAITNVLFQIYTDLPRDFSSTVDWRPARPVLPRP